MSKSSRSSLVPLLAVFGTLLAGLAGWNLGAGEAGVYVWILSLAGGLLLWTVLEYVLHRFVFHLMPPLFSSRQAPPHALHHQKPADRELILTPLSFSVPVSLVVWGGLRLATGSWHRSGLIFAGTLMGYLAYELLHFNIHAGGGGRWMQTWRKYHFRHHFQDSRTCYGVTTPLWDMVLRTYSVPSIPFRGQAVDGGESRPSAVR